MENELRERETETDRTIVYSISRNNNREEDFQFSVYTQELRHKEKLLHAIHLSVILFVSVSIDI